MRSDGSALPLWIWGFAQVVTDLLHVLRKSKSCYAVNVFARFCACWWWRSPFFPPPHHLVIVISISTLPSRRIVVAYSVFIKFSSCPAECAHISYLLMPSPFFAFERAQKVCVKNKIQKELKKMKSNAKVFTNKHTYMPTVANEINTQQCGTKRTAKRIRHTYRKSVSRKKCAPRRESGTRREKKDNAESSGKKNRMQHKVFNVHFWETHNTRAERKQ